MTPARRKALVWELAVLVGLSAATSFWGCAAVDSAARLVGDARSNAQRGDYAHAIESAKRATELDPSYSPGWYWLGVAYQRSDQDDDALRAFQTVIQLNRPGGQLVDSYERVALLSMKRFDYDQALQALDRAQALDYNLGRQSTLDTVRQAKAGREQDERSRREAQAKEQAERQVRAREQAEREARARREQEARATAEAAREAQGRAEREAKEPASGLASADAAQRRALATQAIAAAEQAEGRGDLGAAFREYQRAWLATYRQDDEARWDRVHEALGRLYPKLSDKPPLPEEVRRYLIQADVHYKAERFDEAAQAYRTGLLLAPWWPSGHFNLALLLARGKQYPEAVEHMKRYLRLVPGAPNARVARDKIYEWEASEAAGASPARAGARGAAPQASSPGPATGGWLGIRIQPLTADLAPSFGAREGEGVLVAAVMPGSPAEVGGLKTGDVIVGFEGQKTGEVQELQRAVAGTTPGTVARMLVLRDGRRETLSVKVGEKPSDEPATASRGASSWGLSVRPITPELRRQFKLSSDDGVLVSEVEAETPAARAGIRPGDGIFEVNRRRIRDPRSFEDALGAARQDVLLFVEREGSSFYVVIKAKER